MDKNKKIGFAVIGYGGMGSWHASTCADDFKDTAELIGIYDIKPERRAAAEAEGIHAFSSREELLAAVWGYQFEGYARTVDTHIRRLRNKLGDAAEIIETVRGVGYRCKE